MARVISSSQCNCETCLGESPRRASGFAGGWICVCRCHIDEEFKAKRIAERREQIRDLIRAATENFADGDGDKS